MATAQEVVERFEKRKSYYAARNVGLKALDDLFEGDHWPQEDPREIQLTLNYIRRFIMGNVASLARQPKPIVPEPSEEMAAMSARKREKLLQILWNNLMDAWYDVELDASKHGYGVMQVLWAPEPGQPENVQVGLGLAKKNKKRYTKCPFLFRSIAPKDFYPVFRSYAPDTPMMEAFRFDPRRNLTDLEQRYGIKLQEAGSLTVEGWTALETEPVCDLVEWWTEKEYYLVALTRTTYVLRGRKETKSAYTILSSGVNPYKSIPFYVLQNIRTDPSKDPTYMGSISDIVDIAELNQHLELIVSESADEILTNIHRPLTYSSDNHTQDPSSIALKSGQVYPIGLEEKIEPIPWDGQPEAVQQHIDLLYKVFQDLTFLGEAGMGQLNSGTSGIASRVALAPMQQMLELKLPIRKRLLQRVCEFILRVFEQKAKNIAFEGWLDDQYKQYGQVSVMGTDVDRQYFVVIDYGNLLPRDDYAYEQGEVYKFKTGAQSLKTTLEHLGFDDSQAEMDRILKEKGDRVLNPDLIIQQQQIDQTEQTMAQTQKAMQQPAGAMGGGMPGGGMGGPGAAMGGGGGMAPGGAGMPAGGGGGVNLGQMFLGQGGQAPQPQGAVPPQGPGGMAAQAGAMPNMPGVGAQQGMPTGMPVDENSMSAPPVPTQGAAPRVAGDGPGQLAPFMERPKKAGRR